MKKFLVIFALIIVVLIGYNLIQNQLVIASNNKYFVSKDKDFSKKNGFYFYDYIPLKDSIQLKNNRVKADTAWAEAPWWIGYNILFLPTIYQGGRLITVVIPRDFSKHRFELITEPRGVQSTGLQENQQYFTMANRYTTETLKFVVVYKELEESWDKGIVTDTLTYVAAKKWVK